MSQGGWRRDALVVVAGVVTLAVFAVLYGWLPWWIDGARLRGMTPKDQATVLSGDRGDVLKMVAGAGALVALVYTARKHVLDRQAHALTEQGQVTDRYTKAITQLASDKPSERVGGIYALERIMADSERDHPTVVEVLAAFVRQHATRQGDSGAAAAVSAHGSPPARVHPEADVQAAMTVLARRPARAEPFTVDLRRTALAGLELPEGARLAGANFEEADLAGARFDGAMLSGARFELANLTETHFGRANLTDANFFGATMTAANLHGATIAHARLGRADLTRANLQQTDLTKANLIRATLFDARLGEANLTDARFFKAKLTGARLDGATLTRTVFQSAELVGASFVNASLGETMLSGATLTDANFKSTALYRAKDLTPSQLADALVTSSTKLTVALTENKWVQARVKACQSWKSGDPVPPRTPDPSNVAR